MAYPNFSSIKPIPLKKGYRKIKKCVKYRYDALNRITSAIDNTGNYNLTSVAYDKNGNITSLNRKGHTNIGATLFGNMDLLVYNYETNSNKLKKVTDTSGKTQGFNDGANLTTEYTYDTNGNMITDANKGITSILYNHLNLPTEIKFENSNTKKINYTYDAIGIKLKKVVNDGGSLTTTDYASGYVYENNTLQFFPTSEGYVNNDSGTFKYVYQYKDHLGNVKLSYSDSNNDGQITASTEIIEESNYYPFGLLQKGYNGNVSSNGNSVAQKRKFGGKELQDELELEWYDYGFRNYDPTLGRWMVIDNKSELYVGHSTYHYSANNPIYFKDVDGDYYVGTDGKRVTTSITKDGSIKLSSNASTDLDKMATLINESGSATAASQFNKVGNNETKVNFIISQETKRTKKGFTLLGTHRAHDKDGNVLDWDSESGTFDGEVAYKTDADGNLIYEEVTITIFEDSIDLFEGDNKDSEMVTVNAHENEHNLNKKDIKAIKKRGEGKSNKRDVEKKADKVERKVRREIRRQKRKEDE